MKRFAHLLKSHLSTVLAINSLFAVFCLPWAAWTVICQCFSALLIGDNKPVQGAFTLWCAGNLPCFVLLAVGLALVTRCCVDLYYSDSGNIRASVSKGKSNIGKYVILAVLLWLSSSLAVLTVVWAPKINLPSVAVVAIIAATLLQFVVVLGWTFLCAVQNLFYTDKTSDVAANGIKILFTKPLTVVGCALLALLPFAVAVLLPFVGQLICWTAVLVLLPVVLVLVVVVNYKKIFDRLTETS